MLLNGCRFLIYGCSAADTQTVRSTSDVPAYAQNDSLLISELDSFDQSFAGTGARKEIEAVKKIVQRIWLNEIDVSRASAGFGARYIQSEDHFSRPSGERIELRRSPSFMLPFNSLLLSGVGELISVDAEDVDAGDGDDPEPVDGAGVG